MLFTTAPQTGNGTRRRRTRNLVYAIITKTASVTVVWYKYLSAVYKR